MEASSSKSSLLTDIPMSEVAKLLSTVLRILAWEGIFVNEEYRTVTAHKRVPLVSEHRKAYLEFAANFRWEAYSGDRGPGTVVHIEVLEKSMNWTHKRCGEQITEFETAITDYAKQLSLQGSGKKITGARWASVPELEQADYFSDMAQTRDPKRLLITWSDGQCISIPEAETNRHALVCGPTGSGKTTAVFIPNLIERWGASAIVTEATGGKGVADLYRKTSGFRKNMGHKIYYFNPDAMDSHRINPLDRVRTFRDAWRVVETIMLSTSMASSKPDQTWEMAERLLFAALIMHSVGERAERKCNLGAVIDLLSEGSDGVSRQIALTKIPFARRYYHAFWANSTDKYRNLVAAGLLARLAIWNQPRIRALTEVTDVDISSLPRALFTWYIAVPADKPELKPLAALVFNLAFSFVSEKEFEQPVMLMLDEFTNFGYIKGLPQKLTIMRHDKIPVVLGMQDLVQLENLYGKEAKLLRSQCATRMFFKPNDSDTAVMLSKDLGMSQREETVVTSTGQLLPRVEKAPLMSPDELLNLGVIEEGKDRGGSTRPEMIVFLPSTRPTRLQALTYRDYLDQTNYPPPAREELAVDEALSPEAQLVQDQPKLLVPQNDFEAMVDAKYEQALADADFAFPAEWYKPIVVVFNTVNGQHTRVFDPDTAVIDLEGLALLYELNHPDVRKAVNDRAYQKIQAWLERAIIFMARARSCKYESMAPRPKKVDDAKPEAAEAETIQTEAAQTKRPAVQDAEALDSPAVAALELGENESDEKDDVEEEKDTDLGSFWD